MTPIDTATLQDLLIPMPLLREVEAYVNRYQRPTTPHLLAVLAQDKAALFDALQPATHPGELLKEIDQVEGWLRQADPLQTVWGSDLQVLYWTTSAAADRAPVAEAAA